MRTQIQTERWIELVTSGDFLFEAKIRIGDTEYTRITPPLISRPGLVERLGIGGCLSSGMDVTIYTTDEIPRSSEVEVLGRIKGIDGSSPTDWESYGKFYIDRRDTTIHGQVGLACMDKMLLLEDVFPAADWPMTQQDCAELVADYLGIELDERTSINPSFMVQFPYLMNTMREKMGYIAACNGGNWIITPDDKLYLIPLIRTDTENEIIAVLNSFTLGIPVEIKGVQMIDLGNQVYSAGTTGEGGVVQSISNPEANQIVANNVYSILGGKTYKPFESRGVILDPAIEIGDIVNIKGSTVQIYDMDITLGGSYRVDLHCPDSAEMDSEYPYKTDIQKMKLYTDNSMSVIEDGVEQAQSSANQAQNTATNALTNALNAQTLAEIVQNLVVTEYVTTSEYNRNSQSVQSSFSTMEQRIGQVQDVADGYYDSLSNDVDSLRSAQNSTNSQITAIIANQSTMEQTARSISAEVSQQSTLIGDLETYTENLSARVELTANGVDISGGDTDAKTYVHINGDGLSVTDGENVSAEFVGDHAYVNQVVAYGGLTFQNGRNGQYSAIWYMDDNGRAVLR